MMFVCFPEAGSVFVVFIKSTAGISAVDSLMKKHGLKKFESFKNSLKNTGEGLLVTRRLVDACTKIGKTENGGERSSLVMKNL